MNDVVVLPVVQRKRRRRGARRRVIGGLTADVVDLNAFRYARERALVDRRSSRSLLPDLDMPSDVEA